MEILCDTNDASNRGKHFVPQHFLLPADYLRWCWQDKVQHKRRYDLESALWWPQSAAMMKEATFPQWYLDSTLGEISMDCKYASSHFYLPTACPHRGRDGEGHASYSASPLLSGLFSNPAGSHFTSFTQRSPAILRSSLQGGVNMSQRGKTFCIHTFPIMSPQVYAEDLSIWQGLLGDTVIVLV